MRLHAVRPVRHAQAPDTIKRNAAGSQTGGPVDAPFGQAELAKCPEHRRPVAVGDGFAYGVRVPLGHRPSPCRLSTCAFQDTNRPKKGFRKLTGLWASVSKVEGVYYRTLPLRHFGAVRRRFGVGEASVWRSCRTFLAGKPWPGPTN